jgi:hypothetical protein
MNIAAKAAMLGEEPKSRKQERAEKKVHKLAGKLHKLEEKGDKYSSTETPKKTEYTRVGTEEETPKKSTQFTRVGTEEEAPKKSTQFTKVGSEEEVEKAAKKPTEFTKVGTEEEQETPMKEKKGGIQWTRVPKDDTSTATPAASSDTETKAAVAAGKYSLTKFKPKK